MEIELKIIFSWYGEDQTLKKKNGKRGSSANCNFL